MTDGSDELRRIAERAGADGAPAEHQLERVYAELRSLAGRMMRRERHGHTLQPTALVHEAWLRLADGEATDRAAFLATAARVMRHVLVDHARSRGADKRGGGWRRVTLGGQEADPAEELDLLEVDAALTKLARLDARQARIVELRFFGGLTGDEIAAEVGVSRNTVVRELTVARAWLQRELTEPG